MTSVVFLLGFFGHLAKTVFVVFIVNNACISNIP